MAQTKKYCEIHGEYYSETIEWGETSFNQPCPACADLRTEAREEQERKEQANHEGEKCISLGIDKRNAGINLKNYNPRSNQLSAHDLALKFVDRFDEMKDQGKTLILIGGLGTGKTRLAQAILQTLNTGKYIRVIDIGRQVRASYKNSKTETEVIESFANCDLLVIDEIGVQSDTDAEVMLITDIIDRRYAKMKATIICSNLSKDKLITQFGERAWSRLQHNCVIKTITGESHRVRETK